MLTGSRSLERPHHAQAYDKLADKLSPRSHTQLFQTHLYLEAALPPGKAPRLPLRLHNICRDVSTCLSPHSAALALCVLAQQL